MAEGRPKITTSQFVKEKELLTISVGNLYIGKSKLSFIKNGNYLPSSTLVKDVLVKSSSGDQPYTMTTPEYYVDGLFDTIEDNFFFLDGTPAHRLYISAIPLSVEDVNDYKIVFPTPIWTSYYEDSVRGYLFQIIKNERFRIH